MANTSVDGLVSGLSTSSLIQQLMTVEAQPQQRLKDKVTVQDKIIKAYQSVNSRLSSMETAGDALANANLWKSVKAVSSSDAVTASAASGAATGSLTFNVVSLARAQVQTAVVSATDPIASGNSISVSIGGAAGVAVDISADKTAQGVATAINAKNLDVKAAVVTTSDGTKLLQLSSTKTGSAGVVTVTGLDVTFKDAVTAKDARIEVGDTTDPLSGAYAVTSSTNTFTGLMSGVTLTVKKQESNVSVSVTSDVDGMAAKVQALVDATNSALSEVKTQTAFDVTAGTKQPLAADGQMRQLILTVQSAVGNGLSAVDFPALANRDFKQIGVELDKTGKLVFKKETFTAAYAADPAKVKTVATGLGDKLTDVADTAQTIVTANTQSHNTLVRSLNGQIRNWDARLEAKENALRRQFSNLEIALGKMRDQSNWLAGQLASLPSGS